MYVAAVCQPFIEVFLFISSRDKLG